MNQFPSSEGVEKSTTSGFRGEYIGLFIVLLVLSAVGGGVFHAKVLADGSKSTSDCQLKLTQNRLAEVVGVNERQTLVVLLDDHFQPSPKQIFCVDNESILNRHSYTYGPSVDPKIKGDNLFDVHYLNDEGVNAGFVFYPPGSAPSSKATPTSVVTTKPGADIATATPEK